MRTKEEVIEVYDKLETCIDSRFIRRFCDFLTVDELEQCGTSVKEEYRSTWTVQKEWIERNIIEQLLEDANFGLEKAKNERGISSALMTEVCQAWLYVLEDDEIKPSDYGYNVSFFKQIIDKYGGH